MPLDVTIHPFTIKRFAPYGQVLNLQARGTRRINAGTTVRLDLAAALDLHRARGHAALAAFEPSPTQGFTLPAGTWHHPLITTEDGDFLGIEHARPVVDCGVQQLSEPVRLVHKALRR